MTLALSVILPASNEEAWIGACLDSLLASDPVEGGAEVIVVANACRDATVATALARKALAEANGWHFQVLDLAEGGKLNALNQGDALAQGAVRVYLDADVTVSAGLMAALVKALSADQALYGSGRPKVAKGVSRVTRAYARFWSGLPFAQSVAPGFGLFAVNQKGRARWGAFPKIISDDTYVRLLFTPEERREVPHSYTWPMVEGFKALVKVRRRQDAGVAELQALHPEIFANEGKSPLGTKGILKRAARDPLGFVTYAAVSLAVRARRSEADWTRGR